MTTLFLTVIPSPYQRQLFAAMAEDGMSIAVRYFSGGAHDRVWDLPDLAPYERIMVGRTLRQLGPSAHWNPGVFDEISEVNPELVVISDYSAPTAQMAMRACARRGIQFVFWGEVPGFSRRGPVGTFLRTRLQAPIRLASAIAGIGAGAVVAYRDLFPGKLIVNIPYFCELAQFRMAAAAAPRKNTTDILFSGQMIHRKGIDLLIEAFQRIAGAYPELRLVLLGDGPERAHYEAMVPDALRHRVVFEGHRDPTELPHLFAAADVFCLPSRHDGWGVVVNEALGAGLPLVLSDGVGAGRDLVQAGQTGFVVPAGQVAPLAEALGRLAGDAHLRAQMGRAASEAALQWDVGEGVKRWRALAHSLTKEPATA
ncbi:MAG: glycosyltransferase family 4 protein [Pseudomonadota bacterium]